MAFPQNPSDGMLFEDTVGIYYQYNAATASWYRVSVPSIPLATSVNDGLMPSGDFTKLTGLIVPPPQINLSFDDCDTTYNSGLLIIQGDDEGIVNVAVKPDNILENTGVVEFKLDTQKLVQKLISLGRIRFTAQQGDTGDTGPAGVNGANALPVGPQGVDGKDGANAPWPGTLSEEAFATAQQGRAVVDISVNKVSSAENYIVVRRANIGNPNACPDTIIPEDVQSPWLLGVSIGPGSTTQVVSQSGATCGFACNSDLYYFDMDALVQSVRTHWLNYLNTAKTSKEAMANEWLNAMMKMYNEQKAALCCALEACQSRTRNQNTRQYIETQRIQAAASNFQLIIGSDKDKQFPPLNADGECYWNIAPANLNLIHLSDPNCTVDWSSTCTT